jgi:hypothetical protein
MAAQAQFKTTPPAPYAPAVARQKIRTLIANAGPGNRQQTVDTLSGLLVWYRDTIDDELIAAWKRDGRENLPPLITALGDARLASAIVEFSWHERRSETFNLTYAPMLGNLMARYQPSADPFLRDFAGSVPELTQPEAAAVCRILLDMPDAANWKKSALQILPRYRLAAQDLLLQDLHGNDQEKIYRAQLWMSDLKLNVPGAASDPPQRRKLTLPPPAVTQSSSDLLAQRPHIVEQSSGPPPYTSPYTGPRSGTMKCSGAPVPPNAEYVFSGMPLGNLQIDLDGKPWDARLAPGQGQTQDLILTNRSPSPQKKCTVRWSIRP